MGIKQIPQNTLLTLKIKFMILNPLVQRPNSPVLVKQCRLRPFLGPIPRKLSALVNRLQ